MCLISKSVNSAVPHLRLTNQNPALKHKKSAGVVYYLIQRHRQTPITLIIKQQPAPYAVGYTFPFQASLQHECKHSLLLFQRNKNLANF